jgi:hypothetical protein
MTENTIDRPGEFDALEKARPGELIFTLLERDPCAPAVISFWCELRRKLALDIADEDKRRQELRQITEAELIGMSMLERQKGHQPGAEAPLERPATYSGLTVERTAADEIMPKLRAELAEADYHLANAVELLPRALETDCIGEFLGDWIGKTASEAHHIALELSPHRAALLAESGPA